MIDIKREEREVKDTDYIFGSTSQKCLISIPPQERTLYLPTGELQNIGDEKMDCATRSPINILATKFTYAYKHGLMSLENRKWLEKNGYVTPNGIDFSDRYISILSGTTKRGNSLKAPCRAIENNGLIPKAMFPQVNDWDEYYTGITPKMKRLGQEFRKRFKINYERVLKDKFKEALRVDMLHTAGFAWANRVNGRYMFVDYPPNHAFDTFNYDNQTYYVFDNYNEDGDIHDWIKQLSTKYNYYKWGYRLYVSEENVVSSPLKRLWEKLLNLFRR